MRPGKKQQDPSVCTLENRKRGEGAPKEALLLTQKLLQLTLGYYKLSKLLMFISINLT